tara:strand:+ start:13195 stop:13557 length:363 start_codon:yes stop_codon:yes gene_type:complete
MDPSKPFNFTWNSPPADGFHLFMEDAEGEVVFYIEGIGDTNAVIPAGSLLAGTDYKAHIGVFDITDDARDSFSTGFGASGYLNESFITFTTSSVPEPSSIVFLTLGVFGYAVRRRNRDHG